jgi:Spx/MgsR family transcriptional regulator
MMRVYGLAQCDNCQRAQKWLRSNGHEFEFIDVKKTALPSEEWRRLGAWIGFGKLINRQSTTWRDLLPSRKQPGSDAEYLLLLREYPALLKRPLLVRGEEFIQGFSHGVYERLLGTKP